ncbi:arginase family protein [Baekduia soli]|uniref:Arginase family protein n=1 Tax=Baekduia soli TaxID=496014 RepID=A0A5B8UAI5_9ACTN|nr:arginase family protein [Baekduia soli]QEC50219.1 arginase family protein [Baekduia soli]
MTLTARLQVVAMLCRTGERHPDAARSTEALARELAGRRAVEPRLIGSPSPMREQAFQDDLRQSRGCLLEAGGQVDDALAAGAYPVLVAADCCVSLTTLPAVVRHRPQATILWLDAHADFNTPDTTLSRYLGGMCLAGACGLWDAGFDLPTVEPSAVVMCGVRDFDGGELVLLETHGVMRMTRPGLLADALAGRDVFVHLDLDVLDPSVLPAAFPASGGLSDAGMRTLLAEVAETCDLIGCEITGLGAPELAELVASAVDPLIP